MWCTMVHMPRRKPKTDRDSDNVRTSVILPVSTHAELERLAKKHDRSIAWVIRQAVTTYLDHEHPLFAASPNATKRR